ncbi:protein phosphatase 2 (formerly 2A), regulatory subunit B [Trypanosoma rangeli]|uniref:Protein phosphatase 2 (Formerly 2A), regulatory subunit B n=1 Tax=Trypanosoma rangeli TaxID=5698 RepID=A0A422N4J5_TRYRA|nr:protein phosphatase 2 (formerly 2A), regulatory subunit B [Trypanosoma rangeli]RNF00398.1 protein phosphatase 2 (formerly 2A), regulatory subunit B [Trypanosoma rangeli]|eukprot:RNF00398.1 protein phosphatase 2 (formerly 2A), regulatory subunit B [Trypanosoma rangeli]
MISNRSVSAPPSSGSFSYDAKHFGYRWGELTVGRFSQPASTVSPWRSSIPTTTRYERLAEWRESPYYGGNSYEPQFRRDHGAYYRRTNYELRRSHSSHSAGAEQGQYTLYPAQEKADHFKAHRGFSTPVSSLGTSYTLFQTPSPYDEGRSRGARSSASPATTGNAEIPPLLAAAMSEKQLTRVRASLQSTPTPSQSGVRLKLVELLEYWMSDVLTGAAIEELIAEVHQEAGLKGSHPATEGGNNSAFSVRNATETAGACRARAGEKGRAFIWAAPSSPLSSLSSSSSSSSLTSVSLRRSEAEEEGVAPEPPKEAKIKWIEGGEFFERMHVTDVTSARNGSQVCSSGQSHDVEPMATRPPPRSTLKPTTLPPQTTDSQVPLPAQATYLHIPRFYYPNGLRHSAEETLVGRIINKHENPHLKGVEGMLIPTAVYTNCEERVAVMGSDEFKRPEVKTTPIASLRALEDKDVQPFIQNVFGHLPKLPNVSQGTRISSFGGKGFIGLNNAVQNRQGLNYRLQLTQAMKHICTQCFGLPKYFAFILVKLLQANMDFGSLGAQSVRSSSLSTASSAIRESDAVSQTDCMVQQLQDFFENCLRGRCIIRRVFEVLILSSRVATGGTDKSAWSSSGWKFVQDAAKEQQRSYLLPGDFCAYIEVLLEHHPGLLFLKQTPEFQSKYLETVIYRIFYDLDRFDRGRITYAEMECSSLLDALRQVDATDDINSVLLYFSYEHFYVLYCRFWELDEDRDMLLSREEFMRYAPAGVMNPVIVARVFGGAARRMTCVREDHMNYEDFVWFCLSEEDKSTPTAIRYWFRILDLDGDGILSAYELHSFYDATRAKLTAYIPDGTVPFEDVLCQIFDMLAVEVSCGLRLEELLSKPEAASIALNMVTNVLRFLQFEQRDPFVTHQDRLVGGLEQSAWDRFARAEYDRLSFTRGSE